MGLTELSSQLILEVFRLLVPLVLLIALNSLDAGRAGPLTVIGRYNDVSRRSARLTGGRIAGRLLERDRRRVASSRVSRMLVRLTVGRLAGSLLASTRHVDVGFGCPGTGSGGKVRLRKVDAVACSLDVGFPVRQQLIL